MLVDIALINVGPELELYTSGISEALFNGKVTKTFQNFTKLAIGPCLESILRALPYMYVVLVTTYILVLPKAYPLVERGSKYANTFITCKCTTLHGSLTTICGHVALHMGPLKSAQISCLFGPLCSYRRSYFGRLKSIYNVHLSMSLACWDRSQCTQM